MSTALQTLTTKLANTLDMGVNNGDELVATLKATAFKGGTQVSDAQMTALMVVANQYGLNPWTKEIFAFPDKGGIVPVVGVDGWSRIINNHPQFDGIEFEQDEQSCTAIIYRKDRSHPVKVTEYMAECKRANAGPWQSHPRRMLRHKAMIQCARLAFGYTGIHDLDEAEQIAAGTKNMGVAKEVQTPTVTAEVLDAARQAASMGMADYGEFWKSISIETRNSIGKDEHNRLKDAATKADQARTVDAIPADQQTAYAPEQEIGGAQ
jgi:phage recombination protein Bet